MHATTPKSCNIDEKLVYDAYKAVKDNAGAAGADKQTIEQVDADSMGNRYKIWNRMSSGSCSESCFPPPVLRPVPIPKKNGGQRILERLPYAWNCVINKERLKFKEVEHAGSEKAAQLF